MRFVLILLVLLASAKPSLSSQSQTPSSDTAVDMLHGYIESRLRWDDWKVYSRFITWPDEPGWDCYWVAKSYSIGKASRQAGKVIIPVTYSRLGLFCINPSFELKPKSDVVRYELVRRSGLWKVDAPIPDYPYVDRQVLKTNLKQTAENQHESAERRDKAREALHALMHAAEPQ